MNTIEKITANNLDCLLPLLQWRLEGEKPSNFSFDGFLQKVNDHYQVHENHYSLLKSFLDSGFLLIFAARLEGELVGYTSCFIQPKPNFLLCYSVDEIWVAEEHRNQGVGSLLLQEVEKAARASGAWQIRLYVGNDNDNARAFYKRNGFAETADAVFCTKSIANAK